MWWLLYWSVLILISSVHSFVFHFTVTMKTKLNHLQLELNRVSTGIRHIDVTYSDNSLPNVGHIFRHVMLIKHCILVWRWENDYSRESGWSTFCQHVRKKTTKTNVFVTSIMLTFTQKKKMKRWIHVILKKINTMLWLSRSYIYKVEVKTFQDI